MNDDLALVRKYAAHNSEEAFTTLVSRHISLVHSVALRQTRDPHLAEEIVQTVFIILARKAGSLDSKTILPGWLYRTTNYVSAAALKIKRRRERREQEAYMQAMIEEVQTDSAWEQLSPLLDGAIMQLRESDRDILLLRFFQNKNFKEVGDALGVEERAAQKRVARALEKLHTIFIRRGVTSTTAVLTGAISTNSIQTAPAALIKTTTAVALAKGATASTSTLTIVKGALKLMAWSKAKTAIVISIAAIATLTTTTSIVIKLLYFPAIKDIYFQANYRQFQKLPAGLFVLRPTHFSAPTGGVDFSAETAAPSGQHATWMMGRNRDFEQLVGRAYASPQYLMMLPAAVPQGHFDYLSTILDDKAADRLQAAIKKKLGYVANWQERPTDVYLLTVQTPNSPALKSSPTGSKIMTRQIAPGRFQYQSLPVRNLGFQIQNMANVPVMDATGLTNNFDFIFECDPMDLARQDFGKINQSLAALGLELVLTNMPMQMLVVEKAN